MVATFITKGNVIKYNEGKRSGTKFKKENPFFSTCMYGSHLLSTFFERRYIQKSVPFSTKI